jgi:hypothetical protein
MSFIYSKTSGGFYRTEDQDVYQAAGSWPKDGVAVSDDEHATLMAAQSAGKLIQTDATGTPVAVDRPGPTADQIRTQYETAAQSLLDSTAKAWGYDSVISAASYTTSGVAQYKADAQALIEWRDALWQAAYGVEVSVRGGTAMPATAADFLAMLPAPPARPTA